MRQIRVASSVINSQLRVTFYRANSQKVYMPGSKSADRLDKFLGGITPQRVFIDSFGPSVFYNIPKVVKAVYPPPTGE